MNPSNREKCVVSLLTDFGNKDPYVGVMKAVILQASVNLNLVDLTHEIEPHNVSQASFILSKSFAYFPPHSIHLAVVDPGVGGERKRLVVKYREHFFVAPDNGTLDWMDLTQAEAWELPKNHTLVTRGSISATFEGRDVFAPMIRELLSNPDQFLASLTPFSLVASKISKRVQVISDEEVQGEILFFDRFGNAVTSIDEKHFTPFISAPAEVEVACGKHIFPMKRTYGEVPTGNVLSLFNGYRHLELAVCEGNAKMQASLKKGDTLILRRKR